MARDAIARQYDVDADSIILQPQGPKGNYQLGTIDFTPKKGRSIDLDKMHESITATRLSGGTRMGMDYLELTAKGEVIERDKELVLKVSGSGQELFLSEEMVGPPYDADNMYGWAKLMGELALAAYYKQAGMKSVSCRYFTVYGPRGVENHAVMAMIARAFVGEDPFEVWGTGKQVRNWTYIDDIVNGTLLAAENIDDASAVNLGTTERIRVMDAVQEVLRYTGHKARIVTRPEMPTGPLNRVAANERATKLLGWKPAVSFFEGLHQTIDWYLANKDRLQVKTNLAAMLTERHPGG